LRWHVSDSGEVGRQDIRQTV